MRIHLRNSTFNFFSTAFSKALFVGVLLFSSLAMAYDTSYEDQFDKFKSGTWLNTQNLMSKIHSENIQSLPQLLESLKKADPELMSQYLLSFRSRSLQESSTRYPRVIIVGNHARFAMAFNGRKNHSGYDSLEVIDFNESEKKFELREIKFIEDDLPILSEVNPSRCLKCHQSPQRDQIDPRPNWEPYSMWPGFYGAFTGQFGSTTTFSDRRFGPEDEILKHDILNEKKNLDVFESQIKPDHPRYKHLGTFQIKNTVNYTEGLNKHNFKRVLRLIEETPDFDVYKWSIFSALKCSNFALPEPLFKAHLEGNELLNPKRRKNFVYKWDRDSEFSEFKPKYPAGSSDLSLDMILTLLFESRGISTSDWSMDFRTERGRFAFSERFGSPSFSKKTFLNLAVTKWPFLSTMSCKDLEQKSLQANYKIESIKKADLPAVTTSKVVGRCLSCHGEMESSWSLAPTLPIGSKEKLLRALENKKISKEKFYKKVLWNTGAHATLKQQMPPGEGLTGPERKALLSYLKNLLEI